MVTALYMYLTPEVSQGIHHRCSYCPQSHHAPVSYHSYFLKKICIFFDACCLSMTFSNTESTLCGHTPLGIQAAVISMMGDVSRAQATTF